MRRIVVKNKFFMFIPGLAIMMICFSITNLLADEEKSAWGIAPFPIIAYQPETSLMLGAGSVFYIRPQNGGTKNDDFKVVAFYTLKKQYKIVNDNDIYFKKDLFWLRPGVEYSLFPADYYGIGGNTPESAKEKYTPKKVPLNVSFLMKLYGNLYAGPSYDFQYCSIVKTEKGKALDAGTTGNGTNISSGAGTMIVLDERRGGINPGGGYYAEFRGIRYAHAIGSDNGFILANLDLRAYIPFGETTLGFQFVGSVAHGTIPFYFYPSLGSDSILRGYLEGRYIDRYLSAVQSEYRFPVYERFGGVVFAGVGEVAHTPSGFGKHIRAAVGSGLRFMIDTEEKINIRFDVTYNRKDTFVYVKILEAF
jgi:hypothetical protein